MSEPRLQKQPAFELTKREEEIQELATRGMSSSKIAEALGICLATVNHHRSSIDAKLRAKRNVG